MTVTERLTLREKQIYSNGIIRRRDRPAVTSERFAALSRGRLLLCNPLFSYAGRELVDMKASRKYHEVHRVRWNSHQNGLPVLSRDRFLTRGLLSRV